MRVAILTNFIAPYRVPLLQAFEKRVLDLRVFVSTRMEPNRKWAVDWGQLCVTVQRTLTLRRRWKHPKGFTDTLYVHVPYDTLAQLVRYRPEVIISVEFGMRTLQAALYCIIFRQTRLIVWAQISESTEQARGRLRYWLRRFLTQRMDAVYVNGQSGRRYLQTNFDVPDSKIFYSPITTDVASFSSVPVQRDEETAHRLLYVGQFIERKGIEPFLTTLNDWCDQNRQREFELWIAGSGPLESRIRALQWPDNLSVRFLGEIPYAELPDLYARVGLMIFPTLADEWGLVTVEAMAAGVPVIGSIYAQSVEEMVRNSVNGWRFAPDDVGQTQAAIAAALTTPVQELNEMRRRARSAALALTPTMVTDSMVRALRESASPDAAARRSDNAI